MPTREWRFYCAVLEYSKAFVNVRKAKALSVDVAQAKSTESAGTLLENPYSTLLHAHLSTINAKISKNELFRTVQKNYLELS
jgi:hypothetical protein